MKKLTPLATIILQSGILVALLLPAILNYDESSSLLEYLISSFKSGHTTIVLTGALYYVSVLAGVFLTALLDSKIRYAVVLMSATMGLTLVLVQFIFPALQDSYLFSTYQIGIYLLLGCQFITIVFSCIGICAKESFRPSLSLLESRQDTAEFAAITPERVASSANAAKPNKNAKEKKKKKDKKETAKAN